MTAGERLEKGFLEEHHRIEQKYSKHQPNPNSEYYYSMQFLENLEKESLKNYPGIKQQLTTYINEYKEKDQAVVKDLMKKGYLSEVTPMSYEDQQNIQKVLAAEKGDESDYDSDVDAPDIAKYNRRLFNYIKIQDRVDLPAQTEFDKDKKTLFLEIDDLLIHTFIPDENIGYLQNSATKEPDKDLFLEEAKLNILYYERDNLFTFLEYISKNFEPILFTTSQKLYADFIIKQFDPDGTLFRHRLYQNSCYVLEK